MRLLTDEEMLLVAGGTSSSEVTVWGPPPAMNPPGGGAGGGGSGGGSGSGGSGSGAGPHPTPEAKPDQATDKHLDCIAQHLADLMAAAPNSDKYEYYAFIWKDASGYHASNIETSNLTTQGWNAANPPSLAALGIPSWANVVAEVHSHPTMIQSQNPDGSSTPYWTAEAPSAANPSPGDMQNLNDQAVAMQNSPGSYVGTAGEYRSYVSFGDSVSEYDWQDQDFSPLDNGIGGPAGWATKGNFEPACQP
jgi:hypothetical protein